MSSAGGDITEEEITTFLPPTAGFPPDWALGHSCAAPMLIDPTISASQPFYFLVRRHYPLKSWSYLFNWHSFLPVWERPIPCTLLGYCNAEIDILALIGRQILMAGTTRSRQTNPEKYCLMVTGSIRRCSAHAARTSSVRK